METTLRRTFRKPRLRHQAALLCINYFDRLEAEGRNMKPYRWMTRSAATVDVRAMQELCRAEELEMIELLNNGIGIDNSYNSIDAAISGGGDGYCLGVVQHVP